MQSSQLALSARPPEGPRRFHKLVEALKGATSQGQETAQYDRATGDPKNYDGSYHSCRSH